MAAHLGAGAVVVVSRCKSRAFDADALLDMCERVRAGESATDIARAYGTSVKTLYQVLDAAGVARPSMIGAARAATIRRMRQNNATLEEIAQVVGRSLWTVRNYCKREGITLPAGTERAILDHYAVLEEYRPQNVAKERTCQACRTPFRSQWAGNRRCGNCLRNAANADGPYAI